MIVMLPFPPSVRILVLPTTGFPEKAEVGYEFVAFSRFFFDFDGGGVSIFWFMSFRVTVPCIPHGFTKANGRTTDEAIFVDVLINDFFPKHPKINQESRVKIWVQGEKTEIESLRHVKTGQDGLARLKYLGIYI